MVIKMKIKSLKQHCAPRRNNRLEAVIKVTQSENRSIRTNSGESSGIFLAETYSMDLL